MRVLILGVTGMLGHVVFRVLSSSKDIDVFGTSRGPVEQRGFSGAPLEHVMTGIDCNDWSAVQLAFDATKPDVVINCIGIVKQLPEASDPVVSIQVNALLPHRLIALCKPRCARLIHVSTDCVFTGDKGMYTEADAADARDLYGLSKLLGETETPDSITLRTSIIGPELTGRHGLFEWFLSQKAAVNGYSRAIFSGLTTVELARIIRDIILPRDTMSGLYHLAAAPISKFDLLRLIAAVYGKQIEIREYGDLRVDRSLDSTKFRNETGYVAPDWPTLISAMHVFGQPAVL